MPIQTKMSREMVSVVFRFELTGFFLTWVIIGLPVTLAIARARHIPLTYPIAPDHKLLLLIPFYGLAPVAVELHRRYGSGATWADYGAGWSFTLMLGAVLGFGLGLLGVIALVGGQLALGWQQWRGPKLPQAPGTTSPAWGIVLALLPLTLFIGWVEELIFRGVLVQGLRPLLPWLAMAVVVSAVFALSHLLWDGPAGVPQLPGLALMGAVLLVARWVNGGSLGIPWGLHAGWIFAIALVDTLNLVTPAPTAPVWWVGKPDQPLTGGAALALLAITGLGLWGVSQIGWRSPGLG
ncbi:MAG: CPBP family intramembrane metalloprotease [Leptolyngbya sp. LCM1.Bin17]|nr:MAG: CPBP family intramembrane metalloprotease [Leptolyngbya sp. LCM1.Bin17]